MDTPSFAPSDSSPAVPAAGSELGAADLLLLNQALLDLYRVTTPDRQVESILALMMRLAPSALASSTRFNLRTRALHFTTLPPIPIPAEHVPELARFSHQAPFPSYFAVTRDRGWRMLTDFMPTEDFQRTELFRTMFAPMECAHLLSTMVAGDAEEQFSLTLCRPEPGFSERDRALLNLAHPHLSLSYANALALEESRRTAREFQAVVETSAVGYACAEPDGSIKWITGRARELWGKFYPRDTRTANGMPLPVLEWLRQRLTGSNPGTALAEGSLQQRLGGEQIEIRLLPAPFNGWVISVEAHPAGALPRFRPLPQLSDRQNEVLRWMVEGKRNSEIAEIIAISPRTVEKHVTEVLGRLRAENRATAIVRAMEASAGITPYEI